MPRIAAAFLVLAFSTVLTGVALRDLPVAKAGDPPAGFRSVLNGESARALDRDYRERARTMRDLRPLWNGGLLRAFDETPDRVVAGRDGWFFYAPGLHDPVEPLASQVFQATLGQIVTLNAAVQGSRTRVLTLVVPSKWRLHEDRLARRGIGAERRRVLPRALQALAGAGLEAPDLASLIATEEERIGHALYPPVDSHLSIEGFAFLVTRCVAPALGLKTEDAEAALRSLPRGADRAWVGDLVELLGLGDATLGDGPPDWHEAPYDLPVPADRPGSEVILLGDSFTVHFERVLPRLIEGVCRVAVDGRYAENRLQGREEALYGDYRGRPPRLILVILTERSFSSQ